MLFAEEQTYVVDRLVTLVLVGQPAFRPVLVSMLDVEFAKTIPDNLPNLAEAAATRVLQLCMDDGWNRTPPSVVSLLKLLPNDQMVQKIVDRLRVPPPPTPDPDMEPILTTNQPFIARPFLRQKLKLLTQPQAPKPILVITGEKKTGKSYSGAYVSDFCRRRPDVAVSLQEIFSGVGWPTAEQIARDIVSSMGRLPTNMPPMTTNADRWPLELANWVLVEGAQTQSKWWFVFDGFDSEEIGKDTRAFINFLADRVTTGIYSKMFRVILLGYERGLLSTRPGTIDIDSTEPLSESDVRACVEAILKRGAVNSDPTPFVAQIMDGLPAGEGRHEEINRRLCDLMETVWPL